MNTVAVKKPLAFSSAGAGGSPCRGSHRSIMLAGLAFSLSASLLLGSVSAQTNGSSAPTETAAQKQAREEAKDQAIARNERRAQEEKQRADAILIKIEQAQAATRAAQARADKAEAALKELKAAEAAAAAAPKPPYALPAAFPGAPVLILLPQATTNVPGTLLGSLLEQAVSILGVRIDADEKPTYRVRVPYLLGMGETEVTNAQWALCVADSYCSALNLPSPWNEPNRPAINISWNAIHGLDDKDIPLPGNKGFLNWLNAKAGIAAKSPNRWRLPTEAEWEYAARAGSDGEFSLGKDNNSAISPQAANYNGNFQYKGSPQGEPRKSTVAVKTFAANAWGLHEMHGNVWEWVQDCYDADAYKGRTSDNGWLASVPANGANNCSRVSRGGGWDGGPQGLRTAGRYMLPPVMLYGSIGLRVARTLP